VAADPLSKVFSALADPTRRDMVARLADGDATLVELAEPYDVSVQAVSKHLKVLERAGLISRGRTARLRPSRIRGDALREATEWLHGYRRFWSDSLDRMDERLRSDDDG
jgi:DNA-binding transcriptional ArsR family regulator